MTTERELKILYMHKAGMTDEAIMRQLAEQGDSRAVEYFANQEKYKKVMDSLTKEKQ